MCESLTEFQFFSPTCSFIVKGRLLLIVSESGGGGSSTSPLLLKFTPSHLAAHYKIQKTNKKWETIGGILTLKFPVFEKLWELFYFTVVLLKGCLKVRVRSPFLPFLRDMGWSLKASRGVSVCVCFLTKVKHFYYYILLQILYYIY